MAQGQYAQAQASADSAKQRATWSIILGVGFGFIYFILVVAGVMNAGNMNAAIRRGVLSMGRAHGDPPRVGAAESGAPLAVAASTTLMCTAIWVADPTTPNGPLPVCPTKALLGIDCPGCGSLRMLYSLLHGNLLAAAGFNALALVAVVLLVWAYLAWTYGRVVSRHIRSWQHYRWSAGSDIVVSGGLVCGAQYPFSAIQRAVRLISHLRGARVAAVRVSIGRDSWAAV